MKCPDVNVSERLLPQAKIQSGNAKVGGAGDAFSRNKGCRYGKNRKFKL